jgi:hypothetical protein
MRDGDDARAVREQLSQRGEIHAARGGQRRDAQHRVPLLAEDLPGHQVRVVLEARYQDLIAGPYFRSTERRGHEVQRLGRAANENDLASLRRTQESLDPCPRSLESPCGGLAERMGTPVRFRVVVGSEGPDGFDDAAGPKRCRRAVEIDEPRPLLQSRKLLAQGCGIDTVHGSLMCGSAHFSSKGR